MCNIVRTSSLWTSARSETSASLAIDWGEWPGSRQRGNAQQNDLSRGYQKKLFRRYSNIGRALRKPRASSWPLANRDVQLDRRPPKVYPRTSRPSRVSEADWPAKCTNVASRTDPLWGSSQAHSKMCRCGKQMKHNLYQCDQTQNKLILSKRLRVCQLKLFDLDNFFLAVISEGKWRGAGIKLIIQNRLRSVMAHATAVGLAFVRLYILINLILIDGRFGIIFIVLVEAYGWVDFIGNYIVGANH